ncbi:MAG: DNA-formamidopyrimidine glycosylase family protein [Myxococcota bacterium]|nr:DNA-formamidopyrimidine glycosylase family protein [Myxococcota bacterium]
MPEITAVQFMTENLRQWLLGQRIIGVELREKANLKRLKLDGFPEDTGLCMAVWRRGKHSIIEFQSGFLVLSYQLSGKVIHLRAADSTTSARVIFSLSGGHRIAWLDRINFGSLHWFSTKAAQIDYFKRLGEEFWPIKRDGTWWRNRLRYQRPLHKQLIDQSLVAGIGNIIAIEILHRSGILPQTKPHQVPSEKWTLLAQQARIVVDVSHAQHCRAREQEIAKTGFLRGELHLVSEGNTRAKGFSIYGRQGEVCPQCQTGSIQKGKLDSRPIYWCETCQK